MRSLCSVRWLWANRQLMGLTLCLPPSPSAQTWETSLLLTDRILGPRFTLLARSQALAEIILRELAFEFCIFLQVFFPDALSVLHQERWISAGLLVCLFNSVALLLG